MSHRTGRRWWSALLFVVPGLLLVAVAAFIVWASMPLGPAPEALIAMKSADGIEVTETDIGLCFDPGMDRTGDGLVFYPGGRVDYRSYAPLARRLAQDGTVVIIVRMPLSLAVFGSGGAEDAIASDPDVERWFLAGHSLGGAMACVYADKDPDAIRGLGLLASYPPDSSDLSDSGLRVVSILGSEDGGDREKWESAKRLLPADTVFLEPEGANHAQFGAYGPQPGDGVATISAGEQLELTVTALESLFAR